MHVFLIAAISLDGFIAERTDQVSTDWTSKADKKFFSERTKQAKWMVMGGTTFTTIGRLLPGRVTIIYTRDGKKYAEQYGLPVQDVQEAWPEDPTKTLFTTQLEPKELVKFLAEQSHTELAVCGGGSVYNQFLKAGVVETLYLTLEPILFGDGVKLLNEPQVQHLQLQKSTQLDPNTVVLEYKLTSG